MAVAPCPSCGESARIPSVPLPDQSTLQCPWCGESRSADQWTDSLPPTVRVLDAEGRELEIAARSELETAKTPTDHLRDGGSKDESVSSDPNETIDEFETRPDLDTLARDSAALDQAFSEQSESELTEEDETTAEKAADWNPTRSQPASLRSDQSEPAAGWNMTGDDESYSPVKLDRKRQLMRQALPTLVAVPVLAGILIFTGVDLGFFPFNGFLRKSNPTVAENNDLKGGESETEAQDAAPEDATASPPINIPTGRVLVDQEPAAPTDSTTSEVSGASSNTADALANQFRENSDSPADEIARSVDSQKELPPAEDPSEVAASPNSNLDNRIAAATPAARRFDELTLPGLTSPNEIENETQTLETNEPNRESTKDVTKEEQDLKNALLVFPHDPPRPSPGTAAIDPLAPPQDPPAIEITEADPKTLLVIPGSDANEADAVNEDERPMLPPAIEIVPREEAPNQDESDGNVNPDLRDLPGPALPDLPAEEPNDELVNPTPANEPPVEMKTEEAADDTSTDPPGEPLIVIPPVIVDTPDNETGDDLPSDVPATETAPTLTPPIVAENPNSAANEIQDSQAADNDSEPSSPAIPKNTDKEEPSELIALCQDASSDLEELITKMNLGTNTPRDLASTYRSIALVGAHPKLSTSQSVAKLLEKLNAFDKRDQLEGLAKQWIAWPGRSTPGIFLVGTLRDGVTPEIELTSGSKIPVKVADKLDLSFDQRVLVIGRVDDADESSTVELLAGVAENESARD